MLRQVIVAALCLGMAVVNASAQEPGTVLVYVGTRGNAGAPPGPNPSDRQGIYAARLDTRTGRLTPLGLQVELERASALITHPSLPVVYSVADAGGARAGQANVHAFKVDPQSGKLSEINKVAGGGGDATNMDLDSVSKTLFVAHYGSGDVTALPLQADGRLGPVASSQKNFGTGPHPRQASPHAHGVAAHPSHRYIVSADFGADRLFVYRFDNATRALTPAQTPFETVPPAGAAPRHLVFGKDGRFLYLDTELSAELRVYRLDAKVGRLELVQAVSPYPADYAGTAGRSAAEIAVSRDGRFLYVSLRGDQNSIVAFEINQTDGTLKEIQRIGAQGVRPWSFGIDPTGRWMLVTNEGSNSVNVLRMDPATGKLAPTGESMPVSKAATVTFVGL